jgi:hypothetical protein
MSRIDGRIPSRGGVADVFAGGTTTLSLAPVRRRARCVVAAGDIDLRRFSPGFVEPRRRASGPGRRVRVGPVKPAFWQIAPDGRTIERLYLPEDEPIDIQRSTVRGTKKDG